MKDAKLYCDPEKLKLYKEKRNTAKKLLRTVEAALKNTGKHHEASNPGEFWRLTNQVLRTHKAKVIDTHNDCSSFERMISNCLSSKLALLLSIVSNTSNPVIVVEIGYSI